MRLLNLLFPSAWRLSWRQLKLERQLKSHFHGQAEVQRAQVDVAASLTADEQAIMAAFARRQHSRRDRPLSQIASTRVVLPLVMLRRAAFLAASLILACQMPSEYQVKAGYRLVAVLVGEVAQRAALRNGELEAAVDAMPGVSGVSLQMLRLDQPERLHIDLSLWGINEGQMHTAVKNLQVSFPWLAEASTLDEVPLAAPFHGTLGSRMRHSLGWVTAAELEDLRVLVLRDREGQAVALVRRILRVQIEKRREISSSSNASEETGSGSIDPAGLPR